MTEKEKISLGGALELAEVASKRFEFVFEGTEDQFRFFNYAVNKKIPNHGMTLDKYTDFGHLKNTQFQP